MHFLCFVGNISFTQTLIVSLVYVYYRPRGYSFTTGPRNRTSPVGDRPIPSISLPSLANSSQLRRLPALPLTGPASLGLPYQFPSVAGLPHHPARSGRNTHLWWCIGMPLGEEHSSQICGLRVCSLTRGRSTPIEDRGRGGVKVGRLADRGPDRSMIPTDR